MLFIATPFLTLLQCSAAWDASSCFTILSPAAGCGSGRYVSVDYADGFLFAATAENIFMLAYPPASPGGASCGAPILPADPLRVLLVARAGLDGFLYFSDDRAVGGGLFRVPRPALPPAAPPLPAPRRVCDARCDGVLGARTSLTAGPAALYYGFSNASGGGDGATGVNRLALDTGAASPVFRYAAAQRWVPQDLDGPAELPAPFTSLWYAEWRFQSPGLGTVGMQWMNFSMATGAMRISYLGGDPRAVPPGGSVAVDVRGGAVFFSAGAEPIVGVFNALQRGSPPLNFGVFDFSAAGLGEVADLTFSMGAGGCRFPYEALHSGPAPLACAATPFPGCGLPPSQSPAGSPSPSPPPSQSAPPAAAPAPQAGGSAAAINAAGIFLLLLAAGAVIGGVAWRQQRLRAGAGRLPPPQQHPKSKQRREAGSAEPEEDPTGGELDTAGLVN